jgi:glycerophosphoryl diester phosphodiesterase
MTIPNIIAHRGASAVAPENTLSAFRMARDVGADGFETDVQLTRDGVPVIAHNYSIDAVSDGSGLISEMTYAELRGYDFGSWFGEGFRGERIATLRECLDAGKDYRVVNIELKAPVDRSVPYAVPVADAIASSGFAGNVIVSSFDHSLLKEVKDSHPEIRVGILVPPYMPEAEKVLAACFPAGKSLDSVTVDDVTLPDDMSAIEGLGIRADNPKQAMMEFGRGVGAIYPGLPAGEVVERRRRQADLCNYVKEIGFEVDFVHCHFSSCLRDPGLISRFRSMGIGVNVWTPDSPDDLRALIPLGPDGIITNRPDILRDLLRR